MQKADEEICIISKLMDESGNQFTVTEKVYDQLYDILSNQMPEVLDKGLYIDNSEIVREVINILQYNELFTMIPELAEKNIISLYGKHNRLNDLLNIIGLDIEFFIQNNSNLPLLTIYHSQSEICVYALTYADRLIELSDKEFLLITKELYKKNVEIRKIIKCFVILTDKQPDKSVFCVMPEYASLEDEFFKLIKIFSKDIFITVDKSGQCPQFLSKIKYIHNPVIIVPDHIDVDSYTLDDGFSWNNYEVVTDTQIKLLIKKKNIYCINFMIRSELANVFMRVVKYYVTTENALNKKIELLARDSVSLTEPEVKAQVKDYRNQLISQKDRIIACRKSIEKLETQVLELAAEFEETLSTTLIHDLEEEYDLEFYIQQLVELFLLHVESQKFDGAKDDVIKFLRVNYKYTEELACYCRYVRGYEPTEKEKKKIKDLPDEEWYIAKIKIEMSEILGYADSRLKRIVVYIPKKSTGKEWYYYGKALIDKKQYIEARDAFLNALDFDYTLAGKELICLAENHPECKIDIEELAENLVPEANYLIGCSNIEKKHKKAIVNLKMAASKEYTDAIDMVAEILFNKYKRISWQQMDKEENIRAVNNVINLYIYLCKTNEKEEYRLKIGLMYCKLKEYKRAFQFLKNINNPEAQYECAKMHQYGNGVAKNLNKAKSYYSKISMDYKDTKKQLEKVLSQIERQKVNDSENIDYSPSSSHSNYEGSSYCFITTAACMALHNNKDCEQLNILRRFRDKYILEDGEDGELLVEEYYRVGPILVEKIDREWNPFAIYNELWEDFISPSCKLIYEKKWDRAKRIYIDMVLLLCKQYQVVLEPSIVKKYDIFT